MSRPLPSHALRFPVSSKKIRAGDGAAEVKDNCTVFHCDDDTLIAVNNNLVSKCPFLKRSEQVVEFPYPSHVLLCVTHWVEHYGMDGKCETTFPHPCPYPDFAYVVKDSLFDTEFYADVVNPKQHQSTFLRLINAAEAFKIESLLELLVVALGCMIRGKSESVILYEVLQLPESLELEESDLDAVFSAYPWAKQAMEPTS